MNEKLLKYIPRDDIYYFNTGAARKAWLSFGCHYIAGLKMYRFMVWAPNAKRVTLVGDFNRWDRDATPMDDAADLVIHDKVGQVLSAIIATSPED